MTRKLFRLLVSTCLSVPVGASALGVGRIEVRSALNQPLDAEIDLISVGGDELANLAVELASTQAFVQAGMDRPSLLGDLKFIVQPRADGRSVVKVTSTRPIREPDLDFLVEFSWPKGRLMREFAILLDPPTRIPPAALSGKALLMARPAPAPAAPVSAAGPNAKTYGPVVFGETLSEIARRVRPNPSFSIRQVMDALLRANPGAFSRPNINYLLAGKTLRVPSAEQLKAEASGMPAEQVQVRLVTPEPEQTTQPQPPAPAAQTAAPPSQQTAALAIQTPFQIKLDGSGHPSLRIAGLDELRGRVGTLAAGLDEKPSTPAQESPKPPPLSEPPAAETAAPPLTTQAPVSPAELSTTTAAGFQEATPVVAAAPSASAPQEKTPEAVTPPVVEPPPAAALPPAAAAASAAPIKPAVIDSSVTGQSLLMETLYALFKDPKILGLAGFVLVLLILLTTLLIRRRSASDTDLADELAIVGPDTDRPVTRPSRLAPAVSERITAPSLKSAVVNPLKKADLLLAVGKYDQAEELLQPALASDPSNSSLIAKLLDVYFAAGNREGFLRQAQNLREKLGGNESDPYWDHVREMGRELYPGHPLFSLGVAGLEATEPAAAPAPAVEFDQEPTARTAETETGSLDFQFPVADRESRAISATVEDEITGKGLEWQTHEMEPVTVAEGQDNTLTLAAKEVPEWQLSDWNTATIAPEKPAEQFDGLNFELEEVTTPAWQQTGDETKPLAGNRPGESPEQAEAEDRGGLEAELRGLDFDFDKADQPTAGLAAGAASAEDHVQTKLDLAAAYLDMGDPEGARSLLGEVLQEGNAEQRQQAEAVMARLA